MKHTSNTFEVGETVIATGWYNWSITSGKEYTVTKYQPEMREETFTWPAYVTVIDDTGKPLTGHTYRFKKKELV
jgi:hypothetical protein